MFSPAKTFPFGGPKRQASMFCSPGLVDRGDAGTFTRASVACGIDHNGKYRPVKANEPVLWGSMPDVNFIRQASLTVSPVTTDQFSWDYVIVEAGGNTYACVAAHSAGVLILDVTSPGAFAQVASIRAKDVAGSDIGTPVTDVHVIGSTLFACARTVASDNTSSYIVAYDITDPEAPTWISTYTNSPVGYREWFQGLDSEGTDLYVAAQWSGMRVLDVSNPAAMTMTGSVSTGDWEASRVAVHNGYAYFACHGFGLRILNTDSAAPGGVTDRIITEPTISGDNLRIRNITPDGNYLYACVNTSGSGNSVRRGLLVLDITDPTTIPTDGSTWVHCPIHSSDVDTWNNAGDKPDMGLDKNGHFVYIANGQRGTAVFDVKDPANPRYCGLVGTNMLEGTNLYQTKIFTVSGVDYAIYGDAAMPSGTQNYTFYLDKLSYGAERHRPDPTITRVGELTITPIVSTQFFYHWDIDEENALAYCAAAADGVKAFDISDPALAVLADEERNYSSDHGVGAVGDPVRGICRSSDNQTLYACSRSGTTGRLLSYDISTPGTITHIATKTVTGPLYSDMALLVVDGKDYVVLAGQLSGIWIYDVSDRENMVLVGSQTDGSWETQGVTVRGHYAYFANYDGNGSPAYRFRIVDCSDPTNPTVVANLELAYYNGVALRPWDVFIDEQGEFAYCSVNVATGVGSSPQRGLLVADIRDLDAISGTAWHAHCPIGSTDNDTWNNQGDMPLLGGCKKGAFAYLANGQKGPAIFDVSDPSNPRYVGLAGTTLAAGVNLYDVQAFTLNGQDYLIYGSGAEVPASQTHIFYIDKIDYNESSKGILLEGAATNVLTDPDVPASQVTGSLATGNWTLSCQGSGSITSVAITAVGTGFGAATEGSPNTFNLTGAGTVGLTVVNPLDWIQLEAGAFNTSFVVGARTLHAFTLPGHTFKPNDFSIYFEFTPHALTGLGEEAFFDLVSGAFAYKIYYVPSTRKVWHRKVTGAGTFSHGFVLSVGEIAVGTKIRVACKLEKGVGMKGWANGQAFAGPVTDDSDITTTGTIYVGKRAAGTFPCYGAIGNVQIWHKPLSDTFLSGYGA